MQKKTKAETQFYMIMLPMSSNAIQLIESKLACVTKTLTMLKLFKSPKTSKKCPSDL